MSYSTSTRRVLEYLTTHKDIETIEDAERWLLGTGSTGLPYPYSIGHALGHAREQHQPEWRQVHGQPAEWYPNGTHTIIAQTLTEWYTAAREIASAR